MDYFFWGVLAGSFFNIFLYHFVRCSCIFSGTCRSPLFTSSNPLSLSSPLCVVALVWPCLALLNCRGSSFHLSCLPISSSSFFIPPFRPPPSSSSFSSSSSAAVVYIHAAPATTCWFSHWCAARRLIKKLQRDAPLIVSLFNFNFKVEIGMLFFS